MLLHQRQAFLKYKTRYYSAVGTLNPKVYEYPDVIGRLFIQESYGGNGEHFTVDGRLFLKDIVKKGVH